MGINGERIRALRIKRDLNQEDFGKRSGVGSKQAVSAIEKGKVKNLTIERLEKIASALGVSAKELLD